jgi:hypothetical protein
MTTIDDARDELAGFVAKLDQVKSARANPRRGSLAGRGNHLVLDAEMRELERWVQDLGARLRE